MKLEDNYYVIAEVTLRRPPDERLGEQSVNPSAGIARVNSKDSAHYNHTS